jgi:hypothetical protein
MTDNTKTPTVQQFKEALELIDRPDNIQYYNERDWQAFTRLVEDPGLTWHKMEDMLTSLRMKLP